MMQTQETRVSPNGRGGTIYLSRDLLEDSVCPLQQGAPVEGWLIPGVGVLFVDDPDVEPKLVAKRLLTTAPSAGGD